MHPYTHHWSRDDIPIDVPCVTGAAQLMDGADIKQWMAAFKLTNPLRNVLDVGCGTGRAAMFCEGYVGVDISPHAVAYCTERGVLAHLISDASEMPHGPFNTILCLSVFTHIDRAERQHYLRCFQRRASKHCNVIVDVILGTGGGDVACWTSKEDEIHRDIASAGWRMMNEWRRVTQPFEHTYYHLKGAEK